MPAVVLNVRDLEQLRIDVQPLPNHEFKDGSIAEHPAILSVPVVMPSTGSSAVLMPVKQGDTVLLVFSQKNIDGFKGGSTLPYDTTDNRWTSIQDAVAIIGVSPFSKSPNLRSKHKLPHSPNDMVVVHNLGTDKECEVRLKPSGDIKLTGNNVSIQAKTLRASGEVIVDKGLSVGKGATGVFTTLSGQVVTVANGIVVSIT